MGWISTRRITRGCALYTEGPKKKGPLRKVISTTSWSNPFFGPAGSGWLECGHWLNTLYSRNRAICNKCFEGKPKDKMGKDGWPKFK